MTQEKPTDQQNQQAAHERDSIEDEQKRAAGQNPDKSSHDHMSRERAGDHEGAGGGAKQKENHR